MLRLNGDVQQQIEASMAVFPDLNYRPFNAKQSTGDGILDYETTLIWNGKE